MNSLEPAAVTVLIGLLSARVLISVSREPGRNKRNTRILDMIIAPLLIAFCVIVIRAVVSAAAG